MMKILLIITFIFSLIDIINSGSCSRCKTFENNVYQLKATVSNLTPFYILHTYLPNGLLYETGSVDNGNSVPNYGASFQVNLHSGFYECLSGNVLHVITFGYVYQSNLTDIVKDGAGLGVHEYYLQFFNNDNRQCNGTYSFAVFRAGVNPFGGGQTRLGQSYNNTITCELFNGRGFTL